MDQITLKAHAKINLSLDVVGKKENGYHLLEMVMQEISLYDLVRIEKRLDGALSVSTSLNYLPVDDQNIAYKACRLMMDTYNLPGGYHIHLDKKIPVAAGLAGGSTDAAAVFKGIRELEDLGVSDQELMDLSTKIGSDIAFCLMGGTALAQGIGDRVTPIDTDCNYWIVLIKPALSVSTQHVYQHLDWQSVTKHPNTPALIKALQEGDLYNMLPNMGNVLETVTVAEHPIIETIKKKLLSYGALAAHMSGSGPSVFGLFKRDDMAKKAHKNMLRFYQQAYLVRPVLGRKTDAK
jgi:4-diphosphocytidyl-2-C-methyl-D-erythritol kinase